MKTATIEARLNELRANPEAIAWPDRVRLVGSLLGGCNPARPLDGHSAELARLLAADVKWEVRMALANHLHKLSDSDFAAFTAVLSEDNNAFVKSAAERELARRRKGHNGTAKRVRGLSRMEDGITCPCHIRKVSGTAPRYKRPPCYKPLMMEVIMHSGRGNPRIAP